MEILDIVSVETTGILVTSVMLDVTVCAGGTLVVVILTVLRDVETSTDVDIRVETLTEVVVTVAR